MEMRLGIEKLVSRGDGLARYEGKTIFVRGALPGETVIASVVEQKSDFDRAVVSEIVVASPDRVEPVCPHYGVCGGCDIQHMRTEAQSVHKEKVVKENLKRIGGFDADDPAGGIRLLPVAAAKGWGYRTRVRFHVDIASGRAGFLARGSNELVDVWHCPVLCDSLNRLLDEKRPLLLKAARMRRATEGWQSRNRLTEVPAFAGDTQVSLSVREVAATVAGKTFWVDSNVFFQANRLVLPAMVDFVVSHISGPMVVDLYAGVGTFAAFAEESQRSVVAVERNKRCRELAARNLRRTEFFPMSAEHWVRTHRNRQVSTVIVDPPRTGLDSPVVEAIAFWKPEAIVYVSCDSVTQARDIKRFMQQGYAVKALQVFDLYPQTFHVETCVLLSHKNPQTSPPSL